MMTEVAVTFVSSAVNLPWYCDNITVVHACLSPSISGQDHQSNLSIERLATSDYVMATPLTAISTQSPLHPVTWLCMEIEGYSNCTYVNYSASATKELDADC